MGTNTTQLPDDVELLRSLVLEQQSTIQQLQRENQGLSHRLGLALRRIYGRMSEKIDPNQLLLFGQSMQQAAQSMEAVAAKQDDGQAALQQISPKRKGHGRRPLPADLPRH